MICFRGFVFSLVTCGVALRRSSKTGLNTNRTAFVQKTLEGCECRTLCEATWGTQYTCDTCKTKDGCGSWSPTGRWGYCDYSPSAAKAFIKQSWQDKTKYFWRRITENTQRAQKFPLLGGFLTSVQTTMFNYLPEMPEARQKMIHTVGSVCKFEIDISSNSPYTGMLGAGPKSGFVRLGSGLEPVDGFIPGLGIKFPRTGVPDGDVPLLYSLRAGTSWNFFGKNQSTHIEPVESFKEQVLIRKFRDVTQCPAQVGLSDLARYSQDGKESKRPKFPFKLFMVPGPNVKTGEHEHSLDGVHAEIDAIPVGTVLYSVYACATFKGDVMAPTESLEESCGHPLYLGAMKTVSQCTTSYYGDKSLHIRHTRIEEDWQLEPDYMISYDSTKACGAADSVTVNGAPAKCGEEGMLDSDE